MGGIYKKIRLLTFGAGLSGCAEAPVAQIAVVLVLVVVVGLRMFAYRSGPLRPQNA